MPVKSHASYGVFLRLLEDEHRDLDDLLYPIEGSIRASFACLDKAEETADDEYLRYVVDDECDSIEMHLGLAFVVAQIGITRIISHCRLLHDWQKHTTGSGLLLGIDGNKEKILSTASPRVGSTNHTGLEGINAFANYFKHRDEWPWDWTLLKGSASETARVIQAFRAQPGCTGNLRQGFESIFGENTPYYEVIRIGDTVRDWARALKLAYEQELRGVHRIA